jgi:uroporphyrin-III C-methyltransferase
MSCIAMSGKVIFIGAGPGAADLITLRGARLLATADVVLFDALIDPALRDFAPNARWIHVGKRGFADSTGQATINALLVKHAQSANVVVRLKGGDPSVFGRLEEELQALMAVGIAVEVVPGITAATAAAASTQRPLTRRGDGRSVSLTTAMTVSGELPTHRTADTEVFYMAGKQLAALSRRLLASAWPCDTPVSVVSRAGWPDQRLSDHTVAALAQASMLHAGRPTVVTVGAGALPVVPQTSVETHTRHDSNPPPTEDQPQPLKCAMVAVTTEPAPSPITASFQLHPSEPTS